MKTLALAFIALVVLQSPSAFALKIDCAKLMQSPTDIAGYEIIVTDQAAVNGAAAGADVLSLTHTDRDGKTQDLGGCFAQLSYNGTRVGDIACDGGLDLKYEGPYGDAGDVTRGFYTLKLNTPYFHPVEVMCSVE